MAWRDSRKNVQKTFRIAILPIPSSQNCWIDVEFQNYNSGNSNSKVIPVALEWRGGIGLGPLRRGVGHATPGPHVALAGIGITIPVGSE